MIPAPKTQVKTKTYIGVAIAFAIAAGVVAAIGSAFAVFKIRGSSNTNLVNTWDTNYNSPGPINGMPDTN
jgi:hypothetical protein